MRVLVACECSGVVRDAFVRYGHDAWSCDLKPSERPGNHLMGDVRDHLGAGWDLMIAHPPCTYLTFAGNAWWDEPGRAERREAAWAFVRELAGAPIPRICIENPRGYLSVVWRKADQEIHPYYWGTPHLKRTALWLKNLPPLLWFEDGLFKTACDKPAPLRIEQSGKRRYFTEVARKAEDRSRSWEVIAEEMARQWGLTAAYSIDTLEMFARERSIR